MPEPKLSCPLTLTDRALWFREIELLEDKIVISGWTWTGPVEETVALSNVTKFYKWSKGKGQNFRLTFDHQASIRGEVEGAEFWAEQLEGDERVEVKRTV